jgi:predicted RNase H-like HicB family nuclease
VSEIIFEVREDEAEGGFVARALGYSIVTQADTWEELRDNVQEAVRCHFDEGQGPRIIRLHRVVDELLTLA